MTVTSRFVSMTTNTADRFGAAILAIHVPNSLIAAILIPTPRGSVSTQEGITRQIFTKKSIIPLRHLAEQADVNVKESKYDLFHHKINKLSLFLFICCILV